MVFTKEEGDKMLAESELDVEAGMVAAVVVQDTKLVSGKTETGEKGVKVIEEVE